MTEKQNNKKVTDVKPEKAVTAGGTISLLIVLATAVISVMAAVILGIMPHQSADNLKNQKKEIYESALNVTCTASDDSVFIDIAGLMDKGFKAVCEEDKEKGFLYLKKKFTGKDINLNLYTMKNRENFWGVAKKYGVNIDTIIGSNPELKSINAKTNQKIIVPDKRGVLHEAKAGDSIESIAEKYGADKEELKKANRISVFGIKKGDILFVPGVRPVDFSSEIAKMYDKRGKFRSPIAGSYTSLFGSRTHPVTGEIMKHGAVDIRADIGTWVGASADGTVVYAGWAGSLGNCIKIQHADGYMTIYGHLSKIYVKQGQKVKSGKLIGKTGNTGRTTGPHLHFAIHKNDKPLNPLDYLW